MKILITMTLSKTPMPTIYPVLLPCMNVMVKEKIALFCNNELQNVCLILILLPVF